eukprot:scaffold2294_cov106-Cylindrotheca_fusiformis.AAC.4
MASSSVDEADEFLYSGNGQVVFRNVRRVRVDSSVKELPDHAFKECAHLRIVQLPPTLSRLGKMAFYCCNSLTTINLPSHMTEIPDDAFQSCRSLTNVDLPMLLECIGARAFFECESLTRIVCPAHLRKIGKGAFVHCRSMVSIDLPEGLEEIGDRVFVDCEALESITIPSGVTVIERGTFSHCHSLRTINFAMTGLERIGDGAFWCCGALDSIRIPWTVYSIGNSAFLYCTNLVSVELSLGLETIEQQAFKCCTSLVNIALPSSLESIAEDAFEECDKLRILFPQHELLAKKLRHRFDGLPIHRLCYERAALGTAEDKSNLQQELMVADSSPAQVDCLGMTAFHILALSERDSFDLLLYSWQLVSAKVTLVDETDNWGNCPMDYLCRKKDPTTIASIQTIIRVTTQRRVQQLGLTEWQVAVTSNCENLIERDDVVTRRQRVYDFYLKLLRYERLEALSLLELALWSRKMDDAKNATHETGDLYRSECRINCGSDIVISNVLPFLGDLEAGMSFRITAPDGDP